MNPSRLFIERPVATSLLMVALFLTGLMGYVYLPVSALPEVDYPTITVSTFYPGAGPDVTATSITAPLETQLGQMAGLAQMTSQSSGGASVITLRFDLDTSLDVAEQEVQAAINQSSSLLPTDLPAPPIYAKVNPADTPVLTLGITSDVMPLTQVEDYITSRLQGRISQISGVGLVTLSGGNRKAIRVQINIPKLTSYGIALDTVRTIIDTVNVNSPTGTFDGPKRATTLHVDGQLRSAKQLMDQIIAYQSDGPVRLRDVGRVIVAPENDQLAAWSNTTPALILSVQRQPGANVISVVDNIRSILPRIEKTLPRGIHITLLEDRTTTVRASVAEVKMELGIAIALVVAVIFVFLLNIPATIIPSLSVPLSLVGALGFMYLLGYSLDNLSLVALTISTGFVVDDAIVVIENIARYIEAGETRYDAAIKGSAEIGFTIISLTVSLVAVLIPLLFMGDVVGRLFHEFAATLAITIVLSAVVSITLVPMMCARMLSERAEPSARDRWWHRWARNVETLIAGMIERYGRWLDWVLLHQRATFVVATATVLLTVGLAYEIPKGFFPVQDTGILQGITEMSQTISFDGMKRHQTEVLATLKRDPDVEGLSSFIGIDGQNMTLNVGRVLISLKPLSQRSAPVTEILARLSRKINAIAGVKFYLQPVEDLSLDTSVTAAKYQFILENPDFDLVKKWSQILVARLRHEPSLSGVTSDLQAEGLVARVTLDRANGARYSITPQTVDNLLYDSFGQRQVSTIYTQSNQYRVILEAEPRFKQNLSSLNELYLPGISSNAGQSSSGPTRDPSSGLVPLTEVARVSQSLSPLLITHYGQFPAATISFNVAQGYALGDAVDTIKRVEKAAQLPVTFQTAFQGTAAAFQTSLRHELYLIIAALAAVYIVLGVLYESLIHPLTILSTLPSAGVGALVALAFCGFNLDIMGIIGIVLLIGIVKKNAIMMIDFALEAERNLGLAPIDAIRHAALLRFRPILMTTLAAFFGALPLVIGSGVGAELRRPLGLAILGGLLLSQALTLFTTPVIYLYLDRFSRQVCAKFGLLSLADRRAQGELTREH